ncbi:helix-turn-helix domain-containing protein [Actinomadura sp. 6K520]|uniref:ArsR/SmtB family transcription factor n=1 Tax=Actinomadura sp. 6K520 TaxID=2530364 RepID=UPI00104BE0AA|nr:helix-turn-helix domain-containing protein [Actinomadura sp. 6K520]TDE32561.1 ArsR family transcriptional regulator [Actinomadura sp. 6K520]
MENAELAERVERLEERVARLEGADAQAGGPKADGTFWALDGLKDRVDDPGAVLFTGSVTLPSGEHYEWQQGHTVDDLLADDWSQAAETMSALAHPVRLLLLREILHGARTTAELAAHERLGTTGQLYHHLRQLVAAGWLRTAARGRYSVPGERVVPLLAVLAATRR